MSDERPGGGDVDSPDPSEASPQLRRAFWLIVVLLDVGFSALALGGLMIYFDTRPSMGRAALLLGVLLLGSAYYRYRRARDRLF